MKAELADLTITTAGGTYPVRVLNDGTFEADYNGTLYRDPVYSKLATRIREMVKKHVAMALPGILITMDSAYGSGTGKLKFIDVTITGVHSGTRNILYYHNNNPRAKYQSDRWSGQLSRRLTLDEQKQMQALKDASEKAQEEYEKYTKAFYLPKEQEALVKMWESVKAKQPEDAVKPVKATKAVKGKRT